MALKAGDLNVRAQLLRPTGSKDSANSSYLPGFTLACTVMARVRALRVTEAVLAGQPQGAKTQIVEVRYSPLTAEITAAWRVVIGDRILVLSGPPVNLEEANHTIQMTCVEGPLKR